MYIESHNYLSVVVPCYNEEDCVDVTVSRLRYICDELKNEGKIKKWELIFVNDGSTDDTLTRLVNYSNDKNIKIVNFSRNFGHQPALVAGLNYAGGDVVVTIDADLQDPPEVIGDMLMKIQSGCDCVYGVRSERTTDSFFKRITAEYFYRILAYLGVDIVYNHADFRMMNRFVVDEFLKFTETNLFIRGLVPYIGGKRDTVYYNRRERITGETKFSTLKMLSFAWNGISSFSYVPLRLATIAGFIMLIVLFLGILWSLYLEISGLTIPGWTSIILTILFIGAIEMVFLGIIGEYLGKIYTEIKRRPAYVVKSVVNID